MEKELILASASSRRKEILQSAGFEFKIIPSDYEEKISGKKYSKELVENCACNKALDVFEKNPASIVVGADTVVVLDSIILGKPEDKIEAFSMLKNLSQKTHFVATSICILSDNKILKDTEITFVKFRKLHDFEIENYINSKNPLDKAGSYGIQDDGFDFALSIEGELDNVIGFPLKIFYKLLEKIN